MFCRPTGRDNHRQFGPKLARELVREVRLRELVMGNMSKAKQTQTFPNGGTLNVYYGNALSLLYNPRVSFPRP